jgi:hypothetical protein
LGTTSVTNTTARNSSSSLPPPSFAPGKKLAYGSVCSAPAPGTRSANVRGNSRRDDHDPIAAGWSSP